MANDNQKLASEPSKPARAATVKITNKHKAPLGLPPVTADRAKQRQVDLKGVEYLDRFLDPGENMVSAAHWELVKDQSPVRNWIEEGMLYEGGDRDNKDGPTSGTVRESLASLSEDEALAYVEASTSQQQLMAWNGLDRRKPVRDAIQKRIETLNQSSK